ncbi:MAG: 50S ribosomal protein L21 [Candidatus Wolfebacteria bacterium]|nr:50S ribosomal protein L21 [Candidatus Wolfebacteria bacterium]MDP2704075.1 50S ribosomal protein L21 [bacterium]
MFAIIESGGKQYKVELDGKARVPKLPMEEGREATFDKVLLKTDESGTQIGTPYISGATVQARVLHHGREKKKIVFRYHSKTRYRKKKGHRQDFTEVGITKI